MAQRILFVIAFALLIGGGVVYPVVCQPLGWCAVEPQLPTR